MRLDVPATTAVRFEPGDVKPVTLVEIGGAGVVYGMSGLVQGSVREPGALEKALERLSNGSPSAKRVLRAPQDERRQGR